MNQKKRVTPAINRKLGYVRTQFGTVRADGEGVALFATGPQLESYAQETGVIVDAEAVWVELDNAGRLLNLVPDEEALERPINQWVDALLSRARDHEIEEIYFRGYATGLRAASTRSPAATNPTKRSDPPRPGSMRYKVLRVLADADAWLTSTEVTARSAGLLGEELNRRSVYNALLKEVKRGTVRRCEDTGTVRFFLPRRP